MGRILFGLAAIALGLACGNDGEPKEPGSGGAAGAGGAGGEGGVAGADTGGDGAGGTAPACSGPAWPDNPACEACENERCCITGTNCSADPECVAIMECAVAGGTGCTSGHDAGIWNYSGVVVCLQNNCAVECGIAAAVCGGIQPTPASCTHEIQAACCDQTAACGQSDACVAFIYQCIDQNQCTTQACFEACLARYPEAKEPFDAMADCWSGVGCL